MTTITLHHTLPSVFSQRTDLSSDLWQQEVTFERGHLYLIEADSGTGKSSLCSYLIGYRDDYEGTIRFDDRDIRAFSTYDWTQLRQRSLSSMFQELRLFPELTAWENVQIKNQLTSHKSDADIAAWFEALGIADKRAVKLAQMSFGQQQRVALMRALCQPFDFLLADEPVSHLDAGNSRVMGDIMMEEARRQGAAVIVTSIGHHMDLPYEKVFKL
ncbi:MAG: ATP-binding cassette domain-containing protein [Bacteroidaceae bacterium]|nr:ATP-binding cassette domain-containing protein [Bacteroidaceae bacterium]